MRIFHNLKRSNLSIQECIGLILIVFLFSWISFFPQPIKEKYWLLTQLFLAIFFLFFVLIKEHRARLFSFSDWPLWLLLVCLSAGIPSAIDKKAAFKTYYYLATHLVTLFYIGKALFLSERDRKIVMSVICVFSLFVSLIGILQASYAANLFYKYFIYECRYSPALMRLQATQYNPVVLGSFLLGLLPFTLYFYRNKSLILRLVSLVSFLSTAGVIVLTYSRGAFMGILAMFVYWLWHKKYRKTIVVVLLLVTSLILFFSLGWRSRIFSSGTGIHRLFSVQKGDFAARGRRIMMAYRMVKDHPFSGVGLNHFRIRFKEYNGDNGTEWVKYKYMVADNMYCTLFSETGLLGAGGFLVFILFLLKRGLVHIRRDGGFALTATLAAFIGLLVNMSVYEFFYWSNPFTFFCLLAGFIQGSITKLR